MAAAVTVGLTVNGAVTVLDPQPVTVYSTVTVPAFPPVTTPLCDMVAVPVPANIDQVPPAVASVKAAVFAPEHTVVAPPCMAAAVTVGLTVNGAVTVLDPQPVTVYCTVTVPAFPPVTTPLCDIVAVPVPANIDQVPPAVASVKAAVFAPEHTVVAPPCMAAAVTVGLTVNGAVTVLDPQPVTVYCTVTVPAFPPVTTPLCDIVAVPVPANIDQVPPAVASVKAAVFAPEHTVVAPPCMAAAVTVGLTVNGAVTVLDPQPVTVYCTVTVPALPPVTTPLCDIVAVPVPANIDQVPPAVASVKAAVFAPEHTVVAPPCMAAAVTVGLTVNGAVTVLDPQPVTVYCTVTVPALPPVTTPLCDIVAVPVPANIDQVPPAVASVKAAVFAPEHTVVAPPCMAAAVTVGFTVNGAVTVLDPQPVTVYCTVTVPAFPPVTTPLCDIVAVPVPANIDQVPPAVASVKAAVFAPEHTVVAPPCMAAAVTVGLTVNGAVTVLDPQPVTVYCTVTVPAFPPVTTPPCDIVAVPVPGNIDQVPPAVASVKAAVFAPAHTVDAPPAIATAVTVGLTVNGAVTVLDPQPVTVYCTVTVPALPPVTTPLCDIVAVPVPFNIDQVPPAVASVKAAVFAPEHTVDAPPAIATAVTVGLTVNGAVTVLDPQPVTVYCTVTVPALPPVTTPLCDIVAVPVPFNIDQVPPAVASVKAAVFAPEHTVDAPPAIATAVTVGLTVITD